MKTTIYWTIQHLKRGTHDLRFAATCWWLSQRVDFLEWRWRVAALMPQPIPSTVRVEQGERFAAHPM